jgi:hypothetical protein
MTLHALASLPDFSDYQSLASRLKLDSQLVVKMVDFLVQAGMLIEEQGQLRIGTVRMHLDQESPYISQLHTQWRLKAIESLRAARPEDLHYSSVVTVSLRDAVEIKNLLITQIDKVKGIVRASQDEDAFALSLDFFMV